MPRSVTRAEAITEVARVASERRGRTVLIGIDGCGAAGKSTLAAALAAAFPTVAVVHIDDFAAPSVPEWDWDRFRAQLLLPLLDGRPARYQRWDWERDEGAEWHDVPPGQVVVIEGVSSTRREVGAPWDLTIWVDTPRDLRLERARQRDGPAMLPRWRDEWLPAEEAYVRRERPAGRADLIVSGTEQVVSGSEPR